MLLLHKVSYATNNRALFKDYEWPHKNKEKIKTAIQTIKEERLWRLSEVENSVKASEDLKRSFSKTLVELKKHQE